jgi:hypothetical protein
MRAMKIFLALCVLALGATGCGGGGEASKAAYRSDLAKIAKEAGTAQQRVEGAPQAATVAQIQTLLRQFAADEDRIGDDVSKLKPPKDAADANAELARSQHDDADEVRAAIPKLAKYKSVQQAFGFLQTLGHTKGAREGTEAIFKLRQLGYTSGN